MFRYRWNVRLFFCRGNLAIIGVNKLQHLLCQTKTKPKNI